MTEQLFRTTDEDGDFYLTLAKDSCLSKHGFRCFLRVGSSIHIPEDSLTDLRPVKVVDMDAVVIEEEEALTTDKPNPPRPEPRPEYLRY